MTSWADRVRALTLALLSAPAVVCAPTPSPPTFSVCEVLRDPVRLRGQDLSIRGFLTITNEGTWLGGDCAERLVTGGATWPNVLWPLVTGRADFAALGHLRREISRVRAGTDDRVWVTYVGALETRATMAEEVVVDADGKPRMLGYGHLNSAPAQIIVLTVKDIVIERRRSRQQAQRGG